MHSRLEELVAAAGLTRIASLLRDAALPAVGFSLTQETDPQPVGTSKLGGNPDLPTDFQWPASSGRPLDFLLQINLEDSREHDPRGALPPSGLLTFLYDLHEQPWGYDPANLGGFRVVYTPAGADLRSCDISDSNSLAECSMSLHSMFSLPHYGSRACESLLEAAGMTDAEADVYFELCGQIDALDSASESNHHLLGHSANVQGDMQLEAQLVTNGLYCGDASGYEDPRRQVLEAGADDWQLLLQLDSDDVANIMWGDAGMLYYWIRTGDLVDRRFDNVWMTMQCY